MFLNLWNHQHRRIRQAAQSIVTLLAVFYFIGTLTPMPANACACGCSVFDVGGGLLPQEDDHGGRVFTEWWHSDQNRNWIGGSKGPSDANSDKQVRTDWFTVGLQYMFNRDWGVMVRIPYVNRSFTTDTNFPNDPSTPQTFKSRSFGDVEVMGMYTGF
ncbi:hypothetical protein, partial [Bradyrhizobium sp. STM 3809]|uniref:hypothetical protein n=1 Tax=Bradyrhizobium sp. STM 3809 TaxID=551936 RepID=UPI00191BD0BD